MIYHHDNEGNSHVKQWFFPEDILDILNKNKQPSIKHQKYNWQTNKQKYNFHISKKSLKIWCECRIKL